MTLDQALRLCDALEEVIRKGRRNVAENEVQLRRIQRAFLIESAADPHLSVRAARALTGVRQYLEAPPSHLRLARLRESALTALARLRAAVLLSEEPLRPELRPIPTPPPSARKTAAIA